MSEKILGHRGYSYPKKIINFNNPLTIVVGITRSSKDPSATNGLDDDPSRGQIPGFPHQSARNEEASWTWKHLQDLHPSPVAMRPFYDFDDKMFGIFYSWKKEKNSFDF